MTSPWLRGIHRHHPRCGFPRNSRRFGEQANERARRPRGIGRGGLAVALALAAAPMLLIGCGGDSSGMGSTATRFVETDLVSDRAGGAATTDSALVNPWGIATGPTSPFWISDNEEGVSTLYDTSGTPFPAGAPLVVTLPPPAESPSGTTATPTGVVFNGTSDFVITEGAQSGPALFIFATEDGTISGWNQVVDVGNGLLTVDNSSSGAVFKGLALGSNGTGNFLFATDFSHGTIDVFDHNFAPATMAGEFRDPNIPAGFAPFGIQNIDGNLYVTYAKQNGEKHDDVAGAGNGFVDVFDTDGNLMRRFASQGTLNSPWGLVLAPASFGTFSQALLVGNFGDGRINAFDASSGKFLGQLPGETGAPISISGLWGLIIGNGAKGGDADTLYFTAGTDDEKHGTFGSLRPSMG